MYSQAKRIKNFNFSALNVICCFLFNSPIFLRENQGIHKGESPNSEAQKFYDMLASANEPVFTAAVESRLSIAIRLLANRTNWHTTQKALDDFMQLVLNIAPRENSIPKNYYEAKKIVSTLGLKSVKD